MDIILFGYLSEKNNIFFSFQFTNLVPLMKHWECCGHKGCIVTRRVWFKITTSTQYIVTDNTCKRNGTHSK